MDLSLFENAHFIRPWWLIALPITALIWLLLRNQTAGQQWASHIAKPMLEALQVNIGHSNSNWRAYLLALWVIVTLAAAGPSWDKQAAPTFENKSARVIVLDLSPSMLAQDLTPNRLTLAKYKLIDILREQSDGQAALIAYAGDAHTVSPLTDDPSNIEALLPALHPDVMPIAGSNTESAIALAQDLLSNAGVSQGDIILISDGVAQDAITTIQRDLKRGFTLSVLAVGSTDPTPIPNSSGGFLKKANGEIAVTQLELSELRSFASSTGGNFARLSSDDSDLKQLLKQGINAELNNDQVDSEQVYDTWVDMGHWLILLCLPLALLLFRKGIIYLLPLCMFIGLSNAPDALAQSNDTNNDKNNTQASSLKSTWQSLWLTKDQQASKDFENGDYDTAAERFETDSWAGVSNFKNGNYKAALENFSNTTNSRDLYNKANALAFDGQLEEAIETYQRVLDIDAEHDDAAHNKSVIEELLKQQEQQSQNSDQQNSDQQNSDQQNSDQQNSDQQNSDQQNLDQNEAQENSDQQDSEQQSSEQQDSDSQGQNGEQQQNDNSQQEQSSSEPQNQDSAKESEENESEQENDQTQGSEQSNEEQADEESPQSAKSEQESDDKSDSNGQAKAINTQDPLEESSERWLRSIQDDPSGLLRRKFEYQSKLRSQQRAQQGRAGDTNPTERY